MSLPGRPLRRGPIVVRRADAAKPARARSAPTANAATSARATAPDPRAARARALVQDYLRLRWRAEPRILSTTPSPIEVGKWTVVVADPRNPGGESQPSTFLVDLSSGAVGML